MRLLDGEKEVALWNVQIYLTPAEARELVAGLNKLLLDPEANEHEHVIDGEWSRDFCSSITPTKLKDLSWYTSAEREMFKEK